MHQISLNTRVLRQQMKTKRRQLSTQTQINAAKQVCHQLCEHPLIKRTHTIAGYMSYEGEINMQAYFSHAWLLSKKCYLPIALHKKLAFSAFKQQTLLHKNAWGILEPSLSDGTVIDVTQLGIVVIPLVAFNLQGYRVGSGAGYYDRTFSFLLQASRPQKPYLIGLGYEFQKTHLFEPSAWDVPLHEVITEIRRYQF